MNFQEKSFSIKVLFLPEIKKIIVKWTKIPFLKILYKKPKLCAAQFSKNRKPY
jgi:hypothetical protein